MSLLGVGSNPRCLSSRQKSCPFVISSSSRSCRNEFLAVSASNSIRSFRCISSVKSDFFFVLMYLFSVAFLLFIKNWSSVFTQGCFCFFGFIVFKGASLSIVVCKLLFRQSSKMFGSFYVCCQGLVDVFRCDVFKFPIRDCI